MHRWELGKTGFSHNKEEISNVNTTCIIKSDFTRNGEPMKKEESVVLENTWKLALVDSRVGKTLPSISGCSFWQRTWGTDNLP